MITISDSSPLILSSKLDRLDLLEELYSEVWIPPEVHREVVERGKDEGYADALLVERAVNKFITIKELKGKHLKKAKELKGIYGSGESEAVALALQEDADLILADNLEVRKLSESKGIHWRSTPGILLEALKAELINLPEYEKLIQKLSTHAWISGEVVSEFLKAGFDLKGD